MVLSADIGSKLAVKFGEIQTYKMGVDIIYRGAICCVRQTDGYLYPAVDDTSDTNKQVFAGVAQEGIDNSAGSVGDKSCRVRQEGRWKFKMAGAAQADVGKLACVKDDETIQLWVSGQTTVIVGRITEIETAGSTVFVDVTDRPQRLATSAND